jgi:ribosomal protein L7/L12
LRSPTEIKDAGLSTDAMLARLRQEGADIVESLKVLREVEGISLGQAKIIVDESAAWADRRSANEQLRDVAEKALDENGR